MSNSIWKTGDPTYRNDNFDEIIVREYKRWAADGVFYLVDNYCSELPNRWAYLLDIIAQADKAERLQKAVDLTQERLLSISDGYDIMKADAETIKRLFYAIQDEASETYKEIKQLIKEK